jgi:zinc transport system substrate-binding protein
MFRPLLVAVSICLSALSAQAEVPRVVADIAPVQSLVAQVMQGLGSPDLILRPGAGAHGNALRPSQARALRRADLVFRVGPELTPWLDKPLRALAGGAVQVALLAAPETRVLRFDDGTRDPHAWLDPENGKAWLGRIAEELALADPDNAARYRANAEAGRALIAATSARIAGQLSGLDDVPYITSHDAYRYFEARFGLRNVGALAAGDATPPGAARLTRLRAVVVEQGVGCGFAEPGSDPGLLRAVGPKLRIATLDPLGGGLPVGAELYPALLARIAATLADCLDG